MNLADLERHPRFRLLIWKRNLFLVIALAADLVVLAFLASLRIDVPRRNVPAGGIEILGYIVSLQPLSWTTLGWVAGFLLLQLVLAERDLLQALEEDQATQLYPEDKSQGRVFGSLKASRIVELVQELAEKFGVDKVARIYVTDQPDPNAYTTRLPGVGNIVVLHSNLLEVLPSEGVRCIIAHEVAHIRRKDSFLYLLTSLPKSFIVVVGFFSFGMVLTGLFRWEEWGVFGQRILFCFLAFWVFGRIMYELQRLSNLASQQSELMADACAGAVCGWGPVLNALLLLGERTEALTTLTEALQQLPNRDEIMTEDSLLRILRRFPPRELNKKVAREAAPRLYIEDRLAHLQQEWCVPLSDCEIKDLAQRAAAAVKKKHAEKAEAKKHEQEQHGESPEPTEEEKLVQEEKSLIDWREFDWDWSGHLDAEETKALVQKLRANPERMLFRQFLQPDAEWQSHPTMRDRVLHLHEMFAGT